MPLVSFAAGSRITAALLNEIQPLNVIKPADQSVTSSTTLVNDNALSLPLAVANATYQFACYLDYEGGTLGSSDIKWTWTIPAGATMRYTATYVSTAGTLVASATYLSSTSVVAGTSTAGVLQGATMTGTLLVGATTGTLQLQWAQHTSSGTATIVHAQSGLSLVRVS